MTTAKPPLLELRNVRRVFGGGGLFSQHQVVALKDFSFSLDADMPSITAIVGESGSGKTTMARLVLGLELPSSGRVLYQGKDLARSSGREWRGFRPRRPGDLSGSVRRLQ